MKGTIHKAAFRGHCRSWRVPRPSFKLTTLTLLTLLLGTVCSLAQEKPSESQVETAYLYNFARFVEWPQGQAKGDNFLVCVLGEDPFGRSLDTVLSGEIIASKPAAAKRISEPKDAVSCNVLFISASEEKRLGTTLALLDKSPVLTVSDIPQFSRKGGMIQFVLEGSRVRFEVNLTAAQSAGLTLSSELLRVATAVRRDPPRGD